MYTLTIAHRVCPVLSKTAIGFTSKFSMVKCAAQSLHDAIKFAAVKTKLIVILDGCPREYEDLFQSLFSDGSAEMSIVKTPSILNRPTYEKQIELLLNADSDFVYFSEDDYIYRRKAFLAMMDAIKSRGVDFVTPLDHPGNYRTAKHPVRPKTKVYVTRFGHWANTSSTCLTFMTTSATLHKTEKILRYFVEVGEEGGMWLTLTKYGVFNPYKLIRAALLYTLKPKTSVADYYKMLPLITWKHSGIRVLSTRRHSLWSPVPSLAVHCSSESLPPLSEDIVTEGAGWLDNSVQAVERDYLGLPQ